MHFGQVICNRSGYQPGVTIRRNSISSPVAHRSYKQSGTSGMKMWELQMDLGEAVRVGFGVKYHGAKARTQEPLPLSGRRERLFGRYRGRP